MIWVQKHTPMGNALWAHPKSKYIVPGVIVAALSVMMYMIAHSTISSQLDAYTSNKSQVVSEWVKEGIDGSGVDKSIDYLAYFLRCARAGLSEDIIQGGVGMAVAIFTENSMFDGKHRVIDMLEYLLLAYLEYQGVMRLVRILMNFGTLFALSAALGTGLFLYFTNKKIRRQEQLLYGLFVFEMLFVIIYYFYYDPLKHDRLCLGTLFVEHKDVKPELRDRAVKLAAKYGVGSDSIFVSGILPGINACSMSGTNFKIVVFTPKIILATTDDQLMSVLSHELGHIANRDSINSYRLSIASGVSIYLCGIGVYKVISAYCSGFTGLLSMFYLNSSFNYVLTHLYNYYIHHAMEFRADYEAFKNGYGKASIEFSKMVNTCAVGGTGGAFFDYTKYFGMRWEHPSDLQRIRATRRHMQQ